MANESTSARGNQRRRTRKDLLTAAARLLGEGRTPTMAEVADAALVSRATAYRYFPNIEALLVEAPLDGEMPDGATLFAGEISADPAERADAAEAALHEMVYRNEARLRAMLAMTVGPRPAPADGMPVRQNRRRALIEAALAPAKDRIDPGTYEKLCAALSLVFGPEAMIVFSDVLCVDASEARAVKSWAVRTLVRAAIAQSARP